ncbi:MAG: peptidyl-prolyl cis-trans isomerase, partial [Armatimonadia bacterium]
FDAERKKSSSEQAFQRKLRAEGLTGQAMLDILTTDILLDKLLARQNEVKEETVRKYYAEHRSDYVTPAEVHLFAIVTDTIEDAYLVRERLLSGDKFEDVAKELSKDASKDKGGDMGWLRADALGDKALADVLLTMEPGVVSSPLRAGAKFYIALIKERRPAQTVSFEQAEKDIRKQLQSETTVSRDDYLRSLARKANIKVDWAPAKYLTQDYARLKNIAVIIDGEPLELSTPPVRLPNGSIIVPAKPVLQAVGARLDWRASDQTLTASTPLGRVKMSVGSSKAIVGTTTLEAKDMGQAPVMRDGTLYIAPRAALTALGVDLEWNAIENALILETIEDGLPSPTVPPSRSGLDKQ